MPTISFCFPAYNEEENIEKAVNQAIPVGEKLFNDYEIVITDDGSKDKTADIVRKLAAKNPRIRLIQQENQGYGGSAWTAMSNGQKELVFLTDADLQFDLWELKKFLEFTHSYDAIIGYRAPRADPWQRKFYAWGWNRLSHLALKLPFRDVDCAFKLIKQPTLKDLKILSRGNMFSPELLWRLLNKGLKIKELPVKHFPRQAGQPKGVSKYVIKRALSELKNIYREKKSSLKNM